MKSTLKKLGLAAVTLMLAVVPAVADTYGSFTTWNGAAGNPVTTVNFNGVPVNSSGWNAISSGTTIGGLTFSTGFANLLVANSTYSGFGNYAVGTNTQALTATLCQTCNDYLEINFNGSVRGFGMNMNVYTVPFIIKLSNGATFQITDDGQNMFFGVANVGNFTWARIYSPFPIIGSVSYVNSVTEIANPEPASLFLLGTGLIGGAAGMKRRFKKA